MISVVIATANDERTLAAALSDLVGAAVDGLVREVILADAGSTDATLDIADDAGAVVVRGSWIEAAARAKSDWLLLLPPAPCLAADWQARVAVHVQHGPMTAARLVRDTPWPWRAVRGVLA